MEKLRLWLVSPVDGPLGVLGVLTEWGALIVTLLPADHDDTMLVFVAHRAWAFTEYVPALL